MACGMTQRHRSGGDVREVPSCTLKCQPPAPRALVLITAVGVAACSHNSGGLLCAEPVLIASLSCSCSSCARRRCPSFSSPPHLSAGAGHAHAASVTATSSTHVYSHDDAPLTLLGAPYLAIPCPLPAHSTAGLTPGSSVCLTQHKLYRNSWYLGTTAEPEVAWLEGCRLCT